MNSRARLLLPLFLLVGAASPAPAGEEDPWLTFDDAAEVWEVTGDRVNLRCGPTVNHRDMDQLAKGTLVVKAGADGDWTRVIVPGGVAVYVHRSLVEVKNDAFLATVAAEDVLLRASPTRDEFPVHDQRLARGEAMMVLDPSADMPWPDGWQEEWLYAVAPPRIHSWLHGSFLRQRGTVADLRSELVTAARARLDTLTGGRTKTLREAEAAEVRKRVEKELDEIQVLLDARAVTDKLLDRAHAAVKSAPAGELRERADALLQALVVAMGERRAAEIAQKEREEREAHERKRSDVERRAERFDRDMGELAEAARPARPEADAEGRISSDGRNVLLLRAGRDPLPVRSRRFRLEDYAGRNVKVSGTMRDGTLEIEFLEIVRE